MRKTIRIPWPDPNECGGAAAVFPVIVDWFPPLTEEQILANAWAAAEGKPEPFPDPNLLDVVLERM